MWLADAKSQFRPQAQWASNVTVSVTDPMCYPNDEPRPRKSRLAIALWLLTLIGVIAWASGCTQAIVTKGDTTIRYMTLLKDIDADELRFKVEGMEMDAKGYNANQTEGVKAIVGAAVEAAVKGARP
jgi:hypothetical protein